MRTFVVTGASGFIGSQLVSAIAAQGDKVLALSRRLASLPDRGCVEYGRFDLTEDFPFSGDVLVHCALFRGSRNVSMNIHANARLFEAARRNGFSKIVFLSSIAAESARSNYGKEKRDTEGFLNPSTDLAIRPGLVVGPGGLFKAMRDSIRRFHCAPVFAGGQQPIYTIGINDLCGGILRLIHLDVKGVVILAHKSPQSLRELYLNMAERDGRRIWLPSLPYLPTLGAAVAAEALGIRLPITSESLRGIYNLRKIDIPSYEEFGITPRPFSDVLMEADAS